MHTQTPPIHSSVTRRESYEEWRKRREQDARDHEKGVLQSAYHVHDVIESIIAPTLQKTGTPPPPAAEGPPLQRPMATRNPTCLFMLAKRLERAVPLLFALAIFLLGLMVGRL
jgi:hypothetical protein